MDTLTRNNVVAARELRRRMTPAEGATWNVLRDRQLDGLKFRRQHPVGPYVLDFCSSSLKLVVEIDGPVHEEQIEADRSRPEDLERPGYYFVRVTNEEVFHRPEYVVERIRAAAAQLVSSTTHRKDT